MKTLRGRTLLHLLLVLVIVVLTVTGCGGASGAPTIPPVETLVIPIEDFENSGTGGLICFDTGNHSNWDYAAFTVGIWGAILITKLAVPVAAFRASFQHTPVQQPDGSWIWLYSVNIGNATYTAKLHAQFTTEVITAGIHWSMNISKEGEYQDFLWYYGECDLPATEGFWILKDSPANPTDLLQIDWSRDISTGTHAVTYTNIVPGDPENGGYIDVEYTKENPYDYIWDLYNKSGGNHTYIGWSSTTGEGRVQDFQHFGNDDWHCWASNHTNVTCP
jgi:hypothetical protein